MRTPGHHANTTWAPRRVAAIHPYARRPGDRIVTHSNAQPHSKQNQNKQCIINRLSTKPVPNQCVSQRNDNFSTTHCLEKENSLQPKHLEKAARKVLVSMSRNHRIDLFDAFVTSQATCSAM